MREDVPCSQLAVKVVPGASRSGLAGWLGDVLKVRVSAPPERGKANAELVRVLATALGLAPGDIHVLRGAGTPRKVVQVRGLAAPELRRRLDAGA